MSVEHSILQKVKETLPFCKLVSKMRPRDSIITSSAYEEPLTITFKIDGSTNYSSSKKQHITQTENASGSLKNDSITTNTVDTDLLAFTFIQMSKMKEEGLI